MSKMKMVSVAMALTLVMGFGALATGCGSSAASSAANQAANNTTTTTTTAKDGKATSAEVYDALGDAFTTYFHSDFTAADERAMMQSIINLMPKGFRESSEASEALGTELISSTGNGDEIKAVLEFCNLELTFTPGDPVSASTVSEFNTELKKYNVTGSIEEAYLVDMNMAMSLAIDYQGISAGTSLGEETVSLGSDLFVCKIGGRWFLL